MRAQLVTAKLLEFAIILQVRLFSFLSCRCLKFRHFYRLCFCKLHAEKLQIQRKVKLPPLLCTITCSRLLERRNETAKLVSSEIQWQFMCHKSHLVSLNRFVLDLGRDAFLFCRPIHIIVTKPLTTPCRRQHVFLENIGSRLSKPEDHSLSNNRCGNFT
jgi:hypothetical protein